MALFAREPVAAGSFYPNDPKKLRAVLKSYLPSLPEQAGFLQGMIVPHAGYVYSGKTASLAYKELSKREPRTIVILGSNHSGMGDDVSVLHEARYRTPLGTINNDRALGDRLFKVFNLTSDFLAHSREHSIEVQLPFLQYIYGEKLKILAIAFSKPSLSLLKRIGTFLSRENVTIIASSDFTHHGEVYGYHPFHDVKKEMKEHDLKAIELIQRLKVDEFHKLGEDSTICGYQPITCLLQAMKDRDAKAKFLEYSSSADVTGDYDNVVGYASIIFK